MSSFKARQEMSATEGHRIHLEKRKSMCGDQFQEDHIECNDKHIEFQVEVEGVKFEGSLIENEEYQTQFEDDKHEEDLTKYLKSQIEMGELVGSGIDCEANEMHRGFRGSQIKLHENGFELEENPNRFRKGKNECPGKEIILRRNLNSREEIFIPLQEDRSISDDKRTKVQVEYSDEGQIEVQENPTIECEEYLTQIEEDVVGRNTLKLPRNRIEIDGENALDQCEEAPNRQEEDQGKRIEQQSVFQEDQFECQEKSGNCEEFECDEYETQFVESECEESLFEFQDECVLGKYESGDYSAVESDEMAKKSSELQLTDLDAGEQGNGEQMEYDVLDDLLDEGENVMSSGEEDDWEDSEDDDDVPEEEIDALLDQKLDEYRKRKRPRRNNYGDEMAHEEREKIILKVRGKDHFEVLPEGWIEVTHNSGMPVYLHKATRVCTLSKPYFLGPGSARKHEVPIAAIPCLQYRREVENELQKCVLESESRTDVTGECADGGPSQEDSVSKTNQKLPSAKIETVQENTKEKSLDYMELRKYCQQLFEFKTIKVRRFKTWAGRRKHQKRMKQMHRPTLPLGTKLITCPLPPATDKEGATTANQRRAEFVMNPNGKSYVCILHEYVQHAMRVQPRYLFRELENSSAPYGATVIINEMEYGSGFGSSKKHAKLEAAKSTLEILIPQMKHIDPDGKDKGVQQQDLAFFDEVRVEDPRVSELCAKAGQPSPYQILLECLKRNYGMGDTQIRFDMQSLKHQKNAFIMTVGKHKVEVVCKNKRDGKQRASQGILQLLHPHITSWGSLLRLYGKGSCKTLKEKKLEEQQITELQCRTTANKPNQSILSKLREEMLKLREIRDSLKPIGKFVPTDVELPSISISNLRNVDL